MDWESHNKWAKKLGISYEVSQYVNRVIDNRDPSNLPDDYKQSIGKWANKKQQEDGAKRGNSALSNVLETHIEGTHDKGSGSKTADDMTREATVNFLKQKGDTYIKAFYLHHHLDYLHERRKSGKHFQQLVEEHKQSNSKPYSSEITAFLQRHEKELTRELGL